MTSFLRVLLALVVAIVGVAAFKEIDASKYNLENQKVVESADFNSSSTGWVLWKQCDSRWGGNQLGTCSQTICSAGCAMTSVAMFLNHKGCSKDPGTLNSWLKSNGGYANGCNIYWGTVDKLGYSTYMGKQTPTESEMCNGIAAGHGLIANVHNGGHWVLLTGCQGNGVFSVNDPGYSTTSYHKSDIVDLAVYH